MQVRNDATDEMVTNWKTRPVDPYVTLLGLKTEHKTQQTVASSPLPNDSVFVFSSCRSVSFSRLTGAASRVFAQKIVRSSAELQKYCFKSRDFFKKNTNKNQLSRPISLLGLQRN